MTRYEILHKRIKSGEATEAEIAEFKIICSDILIKLMLENASVFKRLKER